MRAVLAAACLLSTAAPVAAQHAHDHPAAPAARAASAGVQAEQARQLETIRAATARYRDFEVAKREGWRKFGGDTPLMGEHWSRPGAPEQRAGRPLDLANPSNLQYAVIDGRRELVGVSYIVRLLPGEPLPDGFEGSDDVWHVHDAERIVAATTDERPLVGWLIGGWLNDTWRRDGRTRLAMVHAWTGVPNPDGAFRDDHRLLPYLRAGVPVAFAQGATRDAALGIDLAARRGCAEALDGELWIAKAGAATSRRLRTLCAGAAGRVRAALAAAAPPAELNRVAEAAWQEVDAARRQSYTPRQLYRIGIVTEHGAHH